MTALFEKLIPEFLNEISQNYPKLKITVDYDVYDDCVILFHGNEDLYNDPDFKIYSSKLLNQYFYSNGVYSICLDYDPYYFNALYDANLKELHNSLREYENAIRDKFSKGISKQNESSLVFDCS